MPAQAPQQPTVIAVGTGLRRLGFAWMQRESGGHAARPSGRRRVRWWMRVRDGRSENERESTGPGHRMQALGVRDGSILAVGYGGLRDRAMWRWKPSVIAAAATIITTLVASTASAPSALPPSPRPAATPR